MGQGIGDRADLLWRAKGSAVFPVLARHDDGSFRSRLASSDRREAHEPIPVRGVEYAVDDEHRPGAKGTTYRPVATIGDPAVAPAAELAALYAQRWEIESIFDELKTYQRGPRVVLRSRTPEGVYQETWGWRCVHYALPALIHAAAGHGDGDPDRISFTKALHAARRSVRTGLTGAVTLAIALRRATTELLHGLLRGRRLRANARVVRRKMSGYGVKRAPHRAWPQPTLPVADAIRIIGPP